MEKHELERNLESVADNVKVTDLEAETKLSRLFYLQLYSSVLNAERLNKRRERVRRRKQLLTDTKKKVAKSLGWMDLGAWLSRSISSTEQDKDIGDIEVGSRTAWSLVRSSRVPLQSVMVDRFDSRMNSVQGSQRYSGQGGPGPRGGAGAGRAAQPGYNLSSNAIYGQSGAVYGHGHHGKGGDYGPSQGHYGQGGYLLGYERAGAGPRLDHLREVETVSASSGSVNARRRNNRGTLEQVRAGHTETRGGVTRASCAGQRGREHGQPGRGGGPQPRQENRAPPVQQQSRWAAPHPAASRSSRRGVCRARLRGLARHLRAARQRGLAAEAGARGPARLEAGQRQHIQQGGRGGAEVLATHQPEVRLAHILRRRDGQGLPVCGPPGGGQQRQDAEVRLQELQLPTEEPRQRGHLRVAGPLELAARVLQLAVPGPGRHHPRVRDHAALHLAPQLQVRVA